MLPFRALSEGEHRFDYQLDNSFFECYDALSEYAGTIAAEVVLLKKDSKQQIKLSLEGMLFTSCDRCLEPMKLPFEATGDYYLREAEEGEEEKEDVVFVAPENTEIELSQLFYELLMTGLPQKKMHEKKECNEEMLRKLEALKVKKETIDPRWAALEKLTKKEK